MQSLQDKVVIITGATSGIGRCLAMALANRGAALALCGRSEEKLASLTEDLAPAKSRMSRAFCVSSEESIISFVADVEQSLGDVDILINCAGVNSSRANVADLKIADLQWMLSVNLNAPLVFMRETVRSMSVRKSGTIVNVLSTVALFANSGISAYTASKAALDAATKVFRKEVQSSGIKVTAVYPGGVNTAFRAKANPEYMSAQTVADAIVATLELGNDAAVHELVLRPPVETNFC